MRLFRFYISVFLFLPLAIVFFSCSNGNQIDLSLGSEETLRSLSMKKEEDILWTREIESVRLTKDINTSSSVSSVIKLTPEIILLSEVEKSPLYPNLTGFGSLDTREISIELKAFLNKFSESVKKWTLDEKLMEADSLFSLILFKYDVEENWKTFFGRDFNVDEKNPLFESFIYGEPFIAETNVIVPVRFKTNKEHLDLHLYVNTSGDFKITQILIEKWGK